jgi:hypothetical protein
MKKIVAAIICSACFGGASAAFASGITGDYIEVRSADVYTGPCFANSQVGLEGKQAILAWHVQKGSWQGVDLSGLSVVAVVGRAPRSAIPTTTPTLRSRC